MTQLSFTINSLQSALASVERVFDLLDEPEMEADPQPAEGGACVAACGGSRLL